MAKLIPIREAARMLGVTIEQLNDLRSRNEIFGYRDGSSWKFKEEELRRVAGVLASSPPSESGESVPIGGDSEIDADLDELVDVSELNHPDELEAGESASVLSGEAGPAKPEGGKPSTVIGEEDELALEDELSLEADDEGELRLVPGDSDDVVDLEAADEQSSADTANLDDAVAEAADELGWGTEELKLAPDEQLDLSPLEPSAELSPEGSSRAKAEDDDFSLADAEVGVGAEAEDDFVLGGAADESEVSLEEAPTELGSSSSIDDLELGSDDMLTLGEDSGTGGQTVELKADDDFLLTPVDEGLGPEESDSGSQVIPLDSDEFAASAEDMLTEESAEPFLEEETELTGLPEGAEAAVTPLGAGAPLMGLAAEAPYSVWNVLGLGMILLLLLPAGIMMVDLMRNMWSWDQPYSLNSKLMDAILSMFG